MTGSEDYTMDALQETTTCAACKKPINKKEYRSTWSEKDDSVLCLGCTSKHMGY